MNTADLRLVFAGTPAFAAAHLQDLLQRGLNVVSAYSQPDRPSGRGKKLLSTPVKALAATHGVPVMQPLSFTPQAQQELASLKPDLMIVVAYGLLLPPAVLALPRYGCINVHASLLPRWRGAAPVERAILAGDSETGISIMQMDAGLDTGPVLATASTPIHDSDNSETLALRLRTMGSETLAEVLAQIAAGTARAVPQHNELACYAHKLHKHEAQIDWHCSAAHIHNQVRAFYPRSPAWCLHKGQRLRILETAMDAQSATRSPPGTVMAVSSDALQVACEPGVLRIRKVQLEGRNTVTVAELHNGRPDYFEVGAMLQSAASHAET